MKPTIHDLPSSIFHKYIFPRLNDGDVYNFGRALNKELKKISDEYVLLGRVVLIFCRYIFC